MKAPLGGGSLATPVSGQTRMTHPVVDGTSVYWGDPEGGRIEKVPLGGGSPSIVTSGVVAVTALALARTDVYFASGYPVMKAPLAGGSATTVGTAAGADSTVCPVASSKCQTVALM